MWSKGINKGKSRNYLYRNLKIIKLVKLCCKTKS